MCAACRQDTLIHISSCTGCEQSCGSDAAFVFWCLCASLSAAFNSFQPWTTVSWSLRRTTECSSVILWLYFLFLFSNYRPFNISFKKNFFLNPVISLENLWMIFHQLWKINLVIIYINWLLFQLAYINIEIEIIFQFVFSVIEICSLSRQWANIQHETDFIREAPSWRQQLGWAPAATGYG